jgi:hypothetical protein
MAKLLASDDLKDFILPQRPQIGEEGKILAKACGALHQMTEIFKRLDKKEPRLMRLQTFFDYNAAIKRAGKNSNIKRDIAFSEDFFRLQTLCRSYDSHLSAMASDYDDAMETCRL